ncbi:MAG: Flp pilus assembly protein CpaB [Actinomycetota bacterium]
MKARGLTMAVAFLLAATATAAVFLYVSGLEENAETGTEQVEVIVSKEDIPAGTQLDGLLSGGAFTTQLVSRDALVAGAVTSLSELQGEETSAPVLAGEQISTARLQGSGTLPGGVLGIPEGHQAMTVALDAPRTTGGILQSNDHITVYATFTKGPNGEPVTVTLVPDVEVLSVASGLVDEEQPEPSAQLMVTMALKPNEAQKLVFAQEEGSVWLSLLNPDEQGGRNSPTTIFQVVK